MTVLYAIQLFRCIDFCPFSILQCLKELNGNEMMKNVMFNMRLNIVRNMKRLRIDVLVSIHPSGSITLFSVSFSTLALGSSDGRFWAQGKMPRVSASCPGINLILRILVIGTLLLSMFHKVRPVTLSISLRMILESCSLNAGLPIGFSAVITRAGVVAPLPLLPLLPLPHPGCLGSMVAGMLHPLVGTLQYTDVDLTIGQSFRADNK